MKFYALVKKEFVNIPDNLVKTVTKGGRKFAVGNYSHKGKNYQAWKILGKEGIKK